MEKEIWKWILNSFTDEGIANIALVMGIKIPGFRQINPQHKKFKLVRPKIIQAALQQEFAQKLYDFADSSFEEHEEVESYREKSVEELLKLLIEEEEIQPSFLLGILLSDDDEENHEKAFQIYTKLKEEEKLDFLEQQADEKASAADKSDEQDLHDEETFKKLRDELKSAKQMIDKLEKRLKNIEQKNEELKAKEVKTQTALKNEKKRSKEEKSKQSQEINSLKGEIGNLKHRVKSLSPEKDLLQKQLDKQTKLINTKDEEIKRLHALALKQKTDLEKLSSVQERLTEVQENSSESGQKMKVALIGNPKNSRIHQYQKFELKIIEGTKVQEEETHLVLDNTDQVWLLTYKIPRKTQNRVRSLVKGKKVIEFTTFNDLENYMLKGMV